MSSTAAMLEDAILATQQQKAATEQVAAAMVQIREATGVLGSVLDPASSVQTPKMQRAQTPDDGSARAAAASDGSGGERMRLSPEAGSV